MADKAENVTVTTANGRIDAVCDVCQTGVNAVDKGFGRAVIAAFKTQHQHREARREVAAVAAGTSVAANGRDVQQDTNETRGGNEKP